MKLKSRVALFNFRQLCLPLTKNRELGHKQERDKVFPKLAPWILPLLFLREGREQPAMATMKSPNTELQIPTAKDSLFTALWRPSQN